MRLDAWLDSYLNHLRVERALATNTIEAYGRDLGKFIAFAEEQGITNPKDLDLHGVSGWLRSLARNLSARSSARHLSAARGFIRFLMQEGATSSDPTAATPAPKVGRRLPHTLSEAQLLELLDAPDTRSVRGLRDRSMLSLTYSSGLRASELINLTRAELDLERGIVTPLGKGGKRRLCPLGEVALSHLTEYLRALDAAPGGLGRAASHNPRGVVFLSPRGGQLSRQAFWKIVDRYARGVGLGHVHPHQLRHSFASHLLAGGADLRSVQALLGHSSIVTTEIYTHVTQEHVRRAHQKAHPRA